MEGDTAKNGGEQMKNPLVSVIIPTYNYAHLITETLQSVVAQTYTHWECLVIDDGSTDDTHQVVANFIQEFREFKIRYTRTANGGTSAAKNAGLEQASGELIQFLDADDLLSPDKLQIQVALLEQNDAALVFSDSRSFKVIEGIKVQQESHPDWLLATATLSGNQLLEQLIRANIVTISSPLVKTALVRQAAQFDVTLRNNEDWLLWFKVALLQPLFIYDHNDLSYVNIRVHDSSAMKQRHQMFLGEVRVREQFAALLTEQPNDTRQLARINTDLLALHRVRSLEISKGLSYIISNFVKNPISNYPLVKQGCYKLLVRFYKKVIKNEI
jgi:glycosyltransferase involved in cell wall biosynthesis